ncbi:MAG: penicillin-binding protein 2 [Candidatus Omnitrophica bacterium]|nr:penicillin-binding protein 2 [Candidatus Omnitrophota bacterium]
MTSRLAFLKIVILAFLALLAAGLFNVQVLNGSYFRHLSECNRIRLLPLEAPRGRILDRAGDIIAGNRPSFKISVIPEDFDEESQKLLASILKITPEELSERINKGDKTPFGPVTVARDVDKEVLFKTEERAPDLGGVIVQLEGIRYYPYKEIASHVVGYIGKVSLEEYRDQTDGRYSYNDWVGRGGVEAVYDFSLRGDGGGKQFEVDVRGRVVRTLGERMPKPGDDLTLTLDMKLEKAIWDVMAPVKKGASTVVDLKTGEILAMVSKPGYDPNVFVKPGSNKERLRLLKDSSVPLINRNISAAFPPGSVFKIVTATAALESGKATPETRVVCGGSYRLTPHSRPVKCWKEGGHGSVNFYEALEQSCNVYFCQLGRRVGADTLAKYARAYGLDGKSSINLPNVREGTIPDEVWKEERFGEKWYQGETLSFAIGQGFVLVTPLQMLETVGLVANEGTLIRPHIIKDEKVDTMHIDLRPQTFKALKTGMRRVVQSDSGTGHFARVPYFEMAAKTGTAQAPPKTAHAWFAGYFPADNPQVAVVVFVEHGGAGGGIAARVAKGIAQAWKELCHAA